MRKQTKCFLYAFLLACSMYSATGTYAGKTAGPIDEGTKLVTGFMDVAEVPGSAVAVGMNNQIVFEQGFGLSDLENKVRTKTGTKFRLGSVSKMITVASMMRLVDRGLLDLDAPVEKYVTDLPESYRKLTARQLTGHLAGIRHYKPDDFQNDVKHFDSVKDSLKLFTGDPLLHEPGTKYLYSTFGYVLLSAVIEGASGGKNFLKIVSEEVFEPLQMKNSCPDLLQEIIPNKTRYYERSDGRILNARYEDPSYKWGAAGMLSTAADLARFGMAHLQPGYLKQSTLDAMFTSQHTADGKETGIGIGWRIGKDWRGRKVYHHAGNISGGRAVLVMYPDDHLAIAFLTNASSQPAFAESTAQMIADSFLIDSPSIVTKDLAGSYEMSGMNGEKSYTAKLKLQKDVNGYRGEITGAFPLLEAAAKNGLPSKLHICGVRMKGNDPVLILISPFGILDMTLERSETGFNYFVDEGPAKFQGEVKVVP